MLTNTFHHIIFIKQEVNRKYKLVVRRKILAVTPGNSPIVAAFSHHRGLLLCEFQISTPWTLCPVVQHEVNVVQSNIVSYNICSMGHFMILFCQFSRGLNSFQALWDRRRDVYIAWWESDKISDLTSYSSTAGATESSIGSVCLLLANGQLQQQTPFHSQTQRLFGADFSKCSKWTLNYLNYCGSAQWWLSAVLEQPKAILLFLWESPLRHPWPLTFV